MTDKTWNTAITVSFAKLDPRVVVSASFSDRKNNLITHCVGGRVLVACHFFICQRLQCIPVYCSSSCHFDM